MTQDAFLNHTPAADELAGRIIVVTGAGAGIGAAIAEGAAKAGATVVLLGRTMAKLEHVYDTIEKAGGPQPAIFPINFESATAQDFKQLKDALEKEFGHIDALLHNAGILGPKTSIEQYDSDAWQTVMQVNVTAPFMLTQSLLPLLRKADDASVVFTSSGVAGHGRAYWGAYAASKSASDNLMQTLADEFSETPNIRFNAINPGATRTNMRASAYPAENPNSLPAPEEHLAQYLYLLGPASKGVSGEIFVIKR